MIWKINSQIFRYKTVALKFADQVDGLRGVEWVQGLFLFPFVLGKM